MYKHDNSDIQLALLILRNTSRNGLLTPTMRLLGRPTRTILPTITPPSADNTTEQLTKQRNKQKAYTDRTHKGSQQFEIDDSV